MVITRDGTHTGDDNHEYKETKRTPGRGATGSRDVKPTIPNSSNLSSNDDSPIPALSQTTQGLNLSSPKGIFNNNNNNTAYAGGFGNQQ